MITIAIAISIILIALATSYTIYKLGVTIPSLAEDIIIVTQPIAKETANMIGYLGIAVIVAVVACSIIFIVKHNKRDDHEEAKQIFSNTTYWSDHIYDFILLWRWWC